MNDGFNWFIQSKESECLVSAFVNKKDADLFLDLLNGLDSDIIFEIKPIIA